ncbi:hypothetical protein [Streptomyces sp. NPDC057702]|uniref:hypothetical protein n=1 Tax=unclassified Streptomyces TaxID=2593676 RepID=UPI0036772C41
MGETPKVVAAGDLSVPLVVRVVSAVLTLDPRPLVVINETTGPLVEQALHAAGVGFTAVLQQAGMPGMGGAALSALRSLDESPDDVLIVWADMGMVWAPNLWLSVALHQRLASRMSFPTKTRTDPYVSTVRDALGQPCDFLFRRQGDAMPPIGESDCGAFVFDVSMLRDLLESLASSPRTDAAEIDLLPLVRDISAAGESRFAFHLASDSESQGVNTIEELAKANQRYATGLERTRDAFVSAANRTELLDIVTRHGLQPPLVRDFRNQMARTGLLSMDLPPGLRPLCR